MTDINWWTLASGLIGALLGAGGAVCAQIVSAHFTAKREDSRNASEQKRFEQDTANRARDLMFESKRLAFVRALRLVGEMRQLLIRVVLKSWDEELPHSSLFVSEKEQWWVNWHEAHAEFSLLDPLLERDMELLQGLIVDYNEDLNESRGVDALERMKKLDEARENLREAMQRSLAIGQA